MSKKDKNKDGNKKRKTTNRFRDMIGDYYMTNREITKQADARYEKEKKEGKAPWNKREIIMLLITIAALVLILIKYVVF